MPSTMPQLNMRVPEEVFDLLLRLQEHLDRSRPWVVAEALRELARKERLPVSPRPRRKNPKNPPESP
jgi:hypothetical protein